jgi:hypothetical protein
MNNGIPVRGEINTTDATGAGVVVTLYGPDGKTIVPTGRQQLCITDVLICSHVAGRVALCDITDVAGKRLISGTLATDGQLRMSYQHPVWLAPTIVPVLFQTNAGQIDAQINGFIR